jgi:hypothetical protein
MNSFFFSYVAPFGNVCKSVDNCTLNFDPFCQRVDCFCVFCFILLELLYRMPKVTLFGLTCVLVLVLHVTTGVLLQQGVPGLQEEQPRSDVCHKGDEEVGDGEQKHGQPR